MTTSRIFENQRRTALELIGALSERLVPGRPFIADMKSEFALNSRFGARDRRLYREIVFTWLRFREWVKLAGEISPERAADLLVALSPDAPELAPLQTAIGVPGGLSMRSWSETRLRLGDLVPEVDFELRSLVPAWFEGHCPALFRDGEIQTLVHRPPFWLRAQRGTGPDLVRELHRTGIQATSSNDVPGAVRVSSYVDLEKHAVVTNGWAEVQDIGSQALVIMAAPTAGGTWLDFCAGAGGKTLQLAAAVGAKGRVFAHDIRREALVELRRRVLRAKLTNVVIEPVLPDRGLVLFDGVFLDAPCSASGTWRRHPFLRHQTSVTTIRRYAGEQAKLLRSASDYVAPGGRLIYATCSLSRQENEDVVAAFLGDFRDFALERPPVACGVPIAEAGWATILPSTLDGDGYFIACLRRAG